MHIVGTGMEQIDKDVIVFYEAYSSHWIREVIIRSGSVVYTNSTVDIEFRQYFESVEDN